MEEYRTQGRGGVGIITQKTTDKVGRVIGTKKVEDTQDLMISTDKGQVIRMGIGGISVIGRNTQGVRLINLDDKDEVVSGFAVIDQLEEVESVPPVENKH
jgi:DNA gyrase subunit A